MSETKKAEVKRDHHEEDALEDSELEAVVGGSFIPGGRVVSAAVSGLGSIKGQLRDSTASDDGAPGKKRR